jgi:hypothetical protein
MKFHPALEVLFAEESVISFSHHDIVKYSVMWQIFLEVRTASFKYVDEFCL